jgi:hypothetical protein
MSIEHRSGSPARQWPAPETQACARSLAEPSARRPPPAVRSIRVQLQPRPLPPAFGIQPSAPRKPVPCPARDPLLPRDRSSKGWLFGTVSLFLHCAAFGVVVFGAHPASSQASERDLIDVSVEPALGSPRGTLEGSGLGSHVESTVQQRPSPRAAAQKAQRTDPDGVPSPSASVQAPAGPASSAVASTQPEPQPGASQGDPATPAGSANVAPGLGRPDGTPNGTGTDAPKPRMTPQYAGQLAGWFGSRFNVRGLGLDPDELKKLSVAVSISMSPERHVTGFSLRGSSGNSAYDDEVRRTVAAIQSGGLALPEPNDGSTPPANFTVRFRPLVIR